MSADPDERFNETCPPSVMCAACFQSAHTFRPDGSGCQCSCHEETSAGTPAATAPGRAAYEAYLADLQRADPGYGQWVKPFADIDKHDRAAWEAAAQAARADLEAERDSLAGRVAELVTEGNELRALVAEILGRAVFSMNEHELIAKWRARAVLKET